MTIYECRITNADGRSLMTETLLAAGHRRPKDCPASQERNNALREPGTLKRGPKRGKSGRKYPLEIGAQAARNGRITSEESPGKGYVRDPEAEGGTLLDLPKKYPLRTP